MNTKKSLEIDEITGQVVDAAFKLHTRLGPGLLESVYEIVLARELERRGLKVERQKPVSFEFDGLQFDDAFRVDLLIEGCVVVELKSVETLAPVHSKQIPTGSYGIAGCYTVVANRRPSRDGNSAFPLLRTL